MQSICPWALCVIVAAAGCSSNRAPRTAVPADLGGSGLNELAEVYKYMAQNKENPPVKQDDLASYEASLPTAWGKIDRGEYVVMWGVGYVSSGGGVLAYERGVPETGGQVLMQDGTVKQMTAAEFRAAPTPR
jgi:hypothetical protein